MISRSGTGVIVALSCGVMSTVVTAQAPRQTPDSLSGINTDTGTFAPGRRDFSRYSTPGLCLAAALGARDDARRRIETQTAMYRQQGPVYSRDTAPVFHDTLPSAAVTVARTCGARFTPANVAPRDLADLFVLALLQQNDGIASAVLDRRLANVTADSARRALLLDAMHVYLAADPARTTAAAAALEKFDAIPGTREGRIRAHEEWLRIALRAFDHTQIRVEAERMLAVIGTPTDSEYTSYSGFVPEIRARAFRALMALAVADAPDSAIAVATRFLRMTRETPAGVTWLANRGVATEAQAVAFLSPLAPPLDSLRGLPAPSLQATYWFPSKTSAQSKDSRAWPVPGSVSLLLGIRSGSSSDPCSNDMGGVLTRGGFWQSYLTPCYGLLLHVDEWMRRYRAHGLATTVVVGTAGGVLLNGQQAPAEEAESVRGYLQDYLELPVAVAVQERHMTTLAAPDRRIFRDAAPFNATYRGAPFVLADAQGRVLYAGADATLLDAILTRIMNTQHSEPR